VVRRLSRGSLTALLLLSALGLVVGCGQAGPAPEEPSSIERAFEAAHPGGAIPPGLKGVPATRDEVAELVEQVVDDRVQVVLPTYLPPGFLLAAPYIAVGSGGARPNPEGWGDSYRVSYTDGHALIVVTVGADQVPPGLEWHRGGHSATGMALRSAATETGVVIASVSPPWIVVAGEGVTLAQALRTARSLSSAPSR
jgi:hypothetical protein